jgi:hypothetical protein
MFVRTISMLRIYITPPPRITSEDGDISSPPSDGDTPGAPPPRAAAPPGQFFQELFDPRLFGQFAPTRPSAPPGQFFKELLDPRLFGRNVPQPTPPGQFLPSIGVHLPPVIPPAPPPPAPAAPPAQVPAQPPAEREGDGLARNAAAGFSEGVYGTLGSPVDAATWLVNRGIDGVNAVAGSEISNLGDLPLGSRSIATNLEHYAGIPDPAKVRAVTLAEKAARAAGEGAAYAIAPQALLRNGGWSTRDSAPQMALGNASSSRTLGREGVSGSPSFASEPYQPEGGPFHPGAGPDFQRRYLRLAGDPNGHNDKNHNGIDDDKERIESLAPPTSPNARTLPDLPHPPLSPAAGFAGVARLIAKGGGKPGRSPGVAGPPTTPGSNAPRPAISTNEARATGGVGQSLSSGQVAINRANVKALGITDFVSPRQALHMPPVTDGRSVLLVDPQELIAGLHEGKFTILRQPKPGQVIVDFGKPIGEHWERYSGVPTPAGLTRFGAVFFGKKGVHIVPVSSQQW